MCLVTAIVAVRLACPAYTAEAHVLTSLTGAMNSETLPYQQVSLMLNESFHKREILAVLTRFIL